MKYDVVTEAMLWAYVSGNATAEEIQQVEAWKTSNAYDEEFFQEITGIYKKTSVLTTADVVSAKKQFFDEVHKEKTFKKRNLYKYAAVLIVLVLSGMYAFFYTSSDAITITTNYGERKEIKLPEGSLIWLNASSTITYDEKNPRAIYLEGEAFFEVAKNKKVPFTVDTPDHIRVKALGTSFNVKSYGNKAYTETVLLTGKVEVSSDKHFKEKILMDPKDKVTFYKKDKRIEQTVEKTTNTIIGWKEGKIIFKNKSFREIATDLSIQYNIKINFENEQVSNSNFTGTFEENTPIQEILETLQLIKPFEYQSMSEKEYVIK